MDNKLDDKVAFWTLLLHGNYDKYIIVLSGVKNMQAANGDLQHFLREIRQNIGKIVVLEGNKPENAAAHESTFIGTPTKLDGNFLNIWRHFSKGDQIDILQSAPTPEQHIFRLAKTKKFGPNVQINAPESVVGIFLKI